MWKKVYIFFLVRSRRKVTPREAFLTKKKKKFNGFYIFFYISRKFLKFLENS